MKQLETAFSAKKRWEWELSIDCLVGRVYVVWSSPQIPLNNLCFTRTLLTSVLFLGSYFVDENLTTPFNFILGEVLKKWISVAEPRNTTVTLFCFSHSAYACLLYAPFINNLHATPGQRLQVFLSPSAITKEEEAFACREVSYIQFLGVF